MSRIKTTDGYYCRAKGHLAQQDKLVYIDIYAVIRTTSLAGRLSRLKTVRMKTSPDGINEHVSETNFEDIACGLTYGE